MTFRALPLACKAKAQHGFTLVEVLVAMVSGLVVIGAAYSILEVSWRDTSRITDRVSATQIGRGALDAITGELDSACVSREFAPIQEGSKPTELRLLAGYSERAEIQASEVAEHRIAWTEVGKKLVAGEEKPYGTLVDTTYSVGGTWPKFATTGVSTGKRVLAQNVYPMETLEKKPWLFQYEKYAAKSVITETNQASTGLESYTGVSEATGLGKTEAANTAAVLISFKTAPSTNDTRADRISEFSNRVGFALAAPSAEATIKTGPCQ